MSPTLHCPCCQCCPYYLYTHRPGFFPMHTFSMASKFYNNKHRPQACRYPAWASKGNLRWPLQKVWISKATSGFISLWSLTSSNPHFKDPLPKSFCLDHHLQFNPLNHWSRALDEIKLVQRMTTYTSTIPTRFAFRIWKRKTLQVVFKLNICWFLVGSELPEQQ